MGGKNSKVTNFAKNAKTMCKKENETKIVVSNDITTKKLQVSSFITCYLDLLSFYTLFSF